MPLDATLLDLAALVWFLTIWLGYGQIADRMPRRPIGLNHHMIIVREHWMRRMVERENRIVDSQLIGHTIHSVTFFASTTMLVLAGLLSIFGGLDRVYAVVSDLTFTVHTSKQFFEAKMLLLILIFGYGFFKFTWSVRQYNYLCALIGSAPLAPAPPALVDPTVRATARMMSQAVSSFNAGLRAYYFALAELAWFIQPWLFILLTGWMLVVLLRRQLYSHSFRAVETQVRELSAGGEGPTLGR